MSGDGVRFERHDGYASARGWIDTSDTSAGQTAYAFTVPADLAPAETHYFPYPDTVDSPVEAAIRVGVDGIAVVHMYAQWVDRVPVVIDWAVQ